MNLNSRHYTDYWDSVKDSRVQKRENSRAKAKIRTNGWRNSFGPWTDGGCKSNSHRVWDWNSWRRKVFMTFHRSFENQSKKSDYHFHLKSLIMYRRVSGFGEFLITELTKFNWILSSCLIKFSDCIRKKYKSDCKTVDSQSLRIIFMKNEQTSVFFIDCSFFYLRV